jgi:ABC-type Na+ efflux pump permease subunit
VNTPKLINLNVWPVVQRELREGARRPVNHRLRFLSAVVGTLLLWYFVASSDEPESRLGTYLLGHLHAFILGLIFVVVPGLTADCIAREKREGTLGLLFLTPLSAGGIVAGKALVGALRAFTLWLALLPILIIPFIGGGITWFDALSALSLEFCAMVLCMAAGLIASSLARERNTAFVLAYLFGAGFLFLFSWLSEGVLLSDFVFISGYPVPNSFYPQYDKSNNYPFSTAMLCGLNEYEGYAAWSSSFGTTNWSFRQLWTSFCLASPLVTLLIFCAVARFAAYRINRSWQDKVPSIRHEGFLKRYCTPLFQRRFRRKMQRTLDWNPIAWLQQYSWKARLSKWGLCLAFLLIEVAARNADEDTRDTIHTVLLLALAGIYTFAGVSGFLEEKRSGALELLLVTPIPVNKLIFGRVWGLWKQFLPAGLVLAAFFLCNHLYREDWPVVGFVFIVACHFLSLPVFATYFALRVKNLIVAAVLTWIALWIPGCLMLEAFADVVGRFDWSLLVVMFPAAFLSYLAFALLACFLLRHSLSRRIYSF